MRHPGSERAVWDSAVELYATHYISKDWLFDDEMRQLNDALGQMGDATGKAVRSASALPEDLRAALVGAATVHRPACWPAHHGANAAWIAAEKAWQSMGQPLPGVSSKSIWRSGRTIW